MIKAIVMVKKAAALAEQKQWVKLLTWMCKTFNNY
jgi:aspartate ammonia-lyase